MHQHHKTTLLILIFLHAAGAVAGNGNVAFEFPYFTAADDVILIGDSFVRNGELGLTTSGDDTTCSVWSAGVVVYNKPITLLDPVTKTSTSASFSTHFSFKITLPDHTPTSGDGVAFFLSPEAISSSTLRTLGLPKTFVGIEFDTLSDNERFANTREGHVGIIIDSLDPLLSLIKNPKCNICFMTSRISSAINTDKRIQNM